MPIFKILASFCSIIFTGALFSAILIAQDLRFERERHKEMLELVKLDVKKNYFDPAFKGRDLDALFKAAHDKITSAQSVGQMNGIIAQVLVDFDDSHLFFLPPGKANKTDYGIDFEMVGEKCFITSVKKDSDAEKKGVGIGDEIVSIDGYEPTRDNLWKIKYSYFVLRPRARVILAVRKPDGKTIDSEILAKIKIGKVRIDLTAAGGGNDWQHYIRESEDAYNKEVRQYFHDKIEGVFIWRMPGFSLDPSKVDDIMDRVRKHRALILDLRGNGGGRVDMVLRLIGNMFTEDLKVADEKTRKATKEITAKSRGKDSFSGKLIVLIDSGSGSASEVFSKVVQLEGRGRVIGDRSAGAVMESRVFQREMGLDTIITFGTSVTIADLIMKDGKSLERAGVTPDIVLLPTGADIAARRDVVLAKAVELAGGSITPDAAGKIFPQD